MSSSGDDLQDDYEALSRLDFSSERGLCGRDVEIKKLRNLVSQLEFLGDDGKEKDAAPVSEQSSSKIDRACCFVHGTSGSGKTALCMELKRQLEAEDSHHDGILFLTGKFEQYSASSATPYSALVQALSGLGDKILASIQDEEVADEKGNQETMIHIRKALSGEGSPLQALIPSFRQLMQTPEQATIEQSKSQESKTSNITDDAEETRDRRRQSTTTSTTLAQASQRVAVALQAFLRSFLASSGKPMILFVDDLQWMDANSSEVILDAIVQDERLKNLIFIGGYRDDEASQIQVFLEQACSPRPNGIVEDIELHNFSEDGVNELISTTVRLDPSETLELAAVVHRKTLGNPFYTVQFLKAIHQQEFLRFNVMKVCWQWNINSILEETNVTENVATFVARRIQLLPLQVQVLLQLTACVGFSVFLELLEGIHDRCREATTLLGLIECEQKMAVGDAVGFAVAENLLERSGTMVRFSHDKIQQSAYEMIPEPNRIMIHHAIGSSLLEYFGADIRDCFVFFIADQLNRGFSPDTSEDTERIALIRLNRDASLAGRKKSSIDLVVGFLRKAAKLIQASDWEEHYFLVFDVYSLLAEVESHAGRLEESLDLIGALLQNSRSDEDKAVCLFVALAARAATHNYFSNHVEAIRDAQLALKIWGVNLRSSISANVLLELMRMKRLCKGKSREWFKGLPPMQDESVLRAMSLLLSILSTAWAVDPNLYVLVYLKMLDLTIHNGTSDFALHTFMGYACILSTVGQQKSAVWFSILAQDFESKKQFLPSAILLEHGFLSHLRLPAASSLDPLLSGYRLGLETGHAAYGFIDLAVYSDLYLRLGLPLPTFAVDVSLFAEQFKILKQDFLLSVLVANYQLALNLLDRSKNPSVVSWETMNEHGFFTRELAAVQAMSPMAYVTIAFNQMTCAYLLGDWPRVQEAMDSILRRKKKDRRFTGSHAINTFYTFFDGVMGWKLYCVYGKRTYRRVALDAERWLSKMNTVNTVPLLAFVKAERLVTSPSKKSNQRKVKSVYDEAIAMLERSGLSNYAAMANENVGLYMINEVKDQYWAEHYLGRAFALYSEWGALAKTRQMVEQFGFLEQSSSNKPLGGKSLRGRSKFDSSRDTTQALLGDCSNSQSPLIIASN